ncbi:16S rRNA (adenine(1518)-N(6)/adenine(1519)-N(6))-dimethyltransferase RsmA [Elioraea sp.]|uniref:16S rRNA (adenine(1518)-N(6)/adenine(1519)-N(6))- dimethyltransferase RsmA n=1 Tax=Elioraea sp. TaxID=2185103 RepID=UPI003F705609
MTDLPPLREVIARFGLDARKSLGQHFLLDLNLTARIVRAAGAMDGRHAIEIGPGPGGLTRALLASKAASVTAIERDPRCVDALADLVAAHPGRLSIVEADALAVDLGTRVPPPRKVVANLPYNVGTPLLVGWLTQAGAFESLTLMFQQEVAERIVAVPDSSAYGRLSVLAQWIAKARIVLRLPAAAFTPPPKVASAVVHLVPRPGQPSRALFAALERVTAAAFGQRRKMLRSALKPLGDAEALLNEAGIDPSRRAETLSVAEFERLALILSQSHPDH